MNLKLLTGCFLAFLSLAILAAAAFLLLNNIGDQWRMQVFWKPLTLRPAAWLLLAAASGVVIYWTIRKLLPRAIADLRKGAKIRQAKQAQRALKELQKDQRQ